VFRVDAVFDTPLGHGFFYVGPQGCLFAPRGRPYEYHYCPSGFLYHHREEHELLLYRHGHFPRYGQMQPPLYHIASAQWHLACVRREAPKLLMPLVRGLIEAFEKERARFPSENTLFVFKACLVDQDFACHARPDLIELFTPIPPSP